MNREATEEGSAAIAEMSRLQSDPRERSDAVRVHQDGPALRRCRVMLAEDDEDLRSLMRVFLDAEGYEVLSCSDGRRALEIALACDGIDLLITDLEMPHVGGSELAGAVCERHPRTAVILISGREPDPDVMDNIGKRNWLFLPKPFGFPTLLSIIHQRLEANAPSPH